jgi:hypothetical protein
VQISGKQDAAGLEDDVAQRDSQPDGEQHR